MVVRTKRCIGSVGAIPLCLCLALASSLVTERSSAQPAAEVVAPSPITSVEVAYPENARGDAVVVLELVIAEDGSVANAAVRDGEAPFAEAARLGAESFRFSPATPGGIPNTAKKQVRVVFRAPV